MANLAAGQCQQMAQFSTTRCGMPCHLPSTPCCSCHPPTAPPCQPMPAPCRSCNHFNTPPSRLLTLPPSSCRWQGPGCTCQGGSTAAAAVSQSAAGKWCAAGAAGTPLQITAPQPATFANHSCTEAPVGVLSRMQPAPPQCIMPIGKATVVQGRLRTCRRPRPQTGRLQGASCPA